MRCLRMATAATLPLLLAVLAAGCGGTPTGEPGTESGPHWTRGDVPAAVRKAMADDRREAIPDALGYGVQQGREGAFTSKTHTGEGFESQITGDEEGRRGRVRLELWAQTEGRRMAEWREALATEAAVVRDALLTALGEPAYSVLPSGSPAAGAGSNLQTKLIWLPGRWQVAFDPPDFRNRVVVTVERRPWGGDEAPGPTSSRPPDRPDPVRSTPPPAPAETLEAPASEAADTAALDAVHVRYVGLVNRPDSALRHRRMTYAGREWNAVAASGETLELSTDGLTARLEWARMPAELQVACYEALPDKTPRDWFGIAVCCYRKGLPGRGDEVIRPLLDEYPEAKPAIDAFIARQRGTTVPDGGFEVTRDANGRWRFVTPAEQAALQQQSRIGEMADELAQIVQTENGPLQRRALEVVEQLHDSGADGVQRGLAVLGRERNRRLLAMTGADAISEAALQMVKAALDQAREQALTLIRDEERYPDTARNPGQTDVDTALARLRALWRNPAAMVQTRTPRLPAAIARIERIEALMRALSPGAVLQAAPDAVNAALNEQIAIRGLTDTLPEQMVVRMHREVAREIGGARAGSGHERLLLTTVNEYRWMLGLPPLRLNATLAASARRFAGMLVEHAGEPMLADTPTPGAMAREAGYPGRRVSTVLLEPTPDPADAAAPAPSDVLAAWQANPAMHRALLADRWRAAGAGNAGTAWVMLLGDAEDDS